MKGLTLLDIAEREEQMVKDSTSEVFELLFSLIATLDEDLEKMEEEKDALDVALLYSNVETSLAYTDSLLDNILDSTNRISTYAKVESIEKKEKKKIKELYESTLAAVDEFVIAVDELLDFTVKREEEEDEIKKEDLTSFRLITLMNLLPNFENIVDSFYDTAVWADPDFDDLYEGDDEEEDEE